MTDRVKTRFGMTGPRRRRRGLTIIEAVFWLGGFAVLVAGVLGLYTVFTNSQREQQTRQLVANIIGAVRGLYTASVDYDGLDAEVLINAGEIPANFIRGTAGDEIHTPWGGEVTLAGADGAWMIGVDVSDRTDLCIAIASDFVDGTGYHEQVLRADIGGSAAAGTGWASTAAGYSPAQVATNTSDIDSIGDVSTECDGGSDIRIAFR